MTRGYIKPSRYPAWQRSYARGVLIALEDLSTKTPARTDSDVRFVRDLAFTHKCRSMEWKPMVERLIAIYTPLAAIEAVKERLLA